MKNFNINAIRFASFKGMPKKVHPYGMNFEMLNVILGTSGCGKSTVFDLIRGVFGVFGVSDMNTLNDAHLFIGTKDFVPNGYLAEMLSNPFLLQYSFINLNTFQRDVCQKWSTDYNWTYQDSLKILNTFNVLIKKLKSDLTQAISVSVGSITFDTSKISSSEQIKIGFCLLMAIHLHLREQLGIQMPIIIDDIFGVLDYTSKVDLEHVFSHVFNICQKTNNQLIIFTSDDVIFSLVTEIAEYNVAQSRMFPCDDTEECNDGCRSEVFNDLLYHF